jgi:hypothetical protein
LCRQPIKLGGGAADSCTTTLGTNPVGLPEPGFLTWPASFNASIQIHLFCFFTSHQAALEALLSFIFVLWTRYYLQLGLAFCSISSASLPAQRAVIYRGRETSKFASYPSTHPCFAQNTALLLHFGSIGLYYKIRPGVTNMSSDYTPSTTHTIK